MKKYNLLLVVLVSLIFSTSHAGTNSSAKSGQLMQLIGAAANTTVGVIYMGKCGSADPASCVLAGLSFAQAGMALTSASQSGKTKDASECTGSYCNSSGTTPPLDPVTGLPISDGGTLPPDVTDDILGRIQNDLNTDITKLATQGYTYDPATNSIKTPSGSVSVASLSTPDGLKNALGLTDSDLKKMDDIGKQALKEATSLVDGYESGGGGGSRSKAGPGYDDAKGIDMSKYLASLMKKNNGPRGVAGLEKNYGTDQIGVAQDNIFKMVSRRYEVKKPSLNP